MAIQGFVMAQTPLMSDPHTYTYRYLRFNWLTDSIMMEALASCKGQSYSKSVFECHINPGTILCFVSYKATTTQNNLDGKLHELTVGIQTGQERSAGEMVSSCLHQGLPGPGLVELHTAGQTESPAQRHLGWVQTYYTLALTYPLLAEGLKQLNTVGLERRQENKSIV